MAAGLATLKLTAPSGFYEGIGAKNEGVYLAPSAFEAGFVSSAHSDADIDATIAAARKVLAGLQKRI